MADYSGYYQCKECGASGDDRSPAKHMPWCSAPEKIARRERQRAEEELAKKARYEAGIALWESRDDDTVISYAKRIEAQRNYYREQAQLYDQELCYAMVLIRERQGLWNRWLNRHKDVE